MLFAFRELLHAGRRVAAIITAEHGKVPRTTLGEVTRGLEVVEFACGIPHLLKGGFTENASTGVDVYSIRQPLGVVAVITPFNFPAMVPMWMFPIAIACGNTFVLKPTREGSVGRDVAGRAVARGGPARRRLQRRARRQGGGRRAAGPPRRRAVSFVGSTPIARYVYESGTAAGKRVQALGGAKNHMVVLPDADLDLAADAAVNAGFGSAGERCMAISVVVAVGAVGDELVEKIAERLPRLRVGRAPTTVRHGPADHRRAPRQGRVLPRRRCPGGRGARGRRPRHPVTGGAADGFFLGPTLLDHVTRR